MRATVESGTKHTDYGMLCWTVRTRLRTMRRSSTMLFGHLRSLCKRHRDSMHRLPAPARPPALIEPFSQGAGARALAGQAASLLKAGAAAVSPPLRTCTRGRNPRIVQLECFGSPVRVSRPFPDWLPGATFRRTGTRRLPIPFRQAFGSRARATADSPRRSRSTEPCCWRH
jgi:hypothetical protein